MCDTYDGDPRTEGFMSRPGALGVECQCRATQLWLVLSGGRATHESDECCAASIYENQLSPDSPPRDGQQKLK